MSTVPTDIGTEESIAQLAECMKQYLSVWRHRIIPKYHILYGGKAIVEATESCGALNYHVQYYTKPINLKYIHPLFEASSGKSVEYIFKHRLLSLVSFGHFSINSNLSIDVLFYSRM